MLAVLTTAPLVHCKSKAMFLLCVLNFVYKNLTLKGHGSRSLSMDDQDTQDAGCTHLEKLADMMKSEKLNKVIQAGTDMPPPEPAPSTANKWHFSLGLHLLHLSLLFLKPFT